MSLYCRSLQCSFICTAPIVVDSDSRDMATVYTIIETFVYMCMKADQQYSVRPLTNSNNPWHIRCLGLLNSRVISFIW